MSPRSKIDDGLLSEPDEDELMYKMNLVGDDVLAEKQNKFVSIRSLIKNKIKLPDMDYRYN